MPETCLDDVFLIFVVHYAHLKFQKLSIQFPIKSGWCLCLGQAAWIFALVYCYQLLSLMASIDQRQCGWAAGQWTLGRS